MKLPIMYYPPLPCYLVPLRAKYSPQRPIFKHPQTTFLPQCERPSFKHKYKTTGKIIVPKWQPDAQAKTAERTSRSPTVRCNAVTKYVSSKEPITSRGSPPLGLEPGTDSYIFIRYTIYGIYIYRLVSEDKQADIQDVRHSNPKMPYVFSK
jgi:topoisomerase IA-like protein